LPVFPDLAAGMQPEYRGVTIEMLLQHRGGLPDDRADTEFRRRLGRLRGSSDSRSAVAYPARIASTGVRREARSAG
jgi:CubicO group peptidase (beta-lactamase class C family)